MARVYFIAERDGAFPGEFAGVVEQRAHHERKVFGVCTDGGRVLRGFDREGHPGIAAKPRSGEQFGAAHFVDVGFLQPQGLGQAVEVGGFEHVVERRKQQVGVDADGFAAGVPLGSVDVRQHQTRGCGVDGVECGADAAADRVYEDRFHVFALLGLAAVAEDVGLQPAVAQQRPQEVDPRAGHQQHDDHDREARGGAVTDQGPRFGQLALVQVVLPADRFEAFAAFGGEDRILHLHRVLEGLESLRVTLGLGEQDAAVAVGLVDLVGQHAEIALATFDQADQRIGILDAFGIGAGVGFPEVAHFVEVTFVAQQVFPFGREHTAAELVEVPGGVVVAADIERTLHQLLVRPHVAVVLIEVGAPPEGAVGGIVAVEQCDLVIGERDLFVVAVALVVGAAQHVVNDAGEAPADIEVRHLLRQLVGFAPRVGLRDIGPPVSALVVAEREVGVAAQEQAFGALVDVLGLFGRGVAPVVNLMCQPEVLRKVVLVPQAVEPDAHFGIGVGTLFGCAGSQVAERLYVIAERIFLFDIDRIPAEDRDDGHRHGVGVADVRRFAEKLDGIRQVEVRVLVQVFEVEQ